MALLNPALDALDAVGYLEGPGRNLLGPTDFFNLAEDIGACLQELAGHSMAGVQGKGMPSGETADHRPGYHGIRRFPQRPDELGERVSVAQDFLLGGRVKVGELVDGIAGGDANGTFVRMDEPFIEVLAPVFVGYQPVFATNNAFGREGLNLVDFLGFGLVSAQENGWVPGFPGRGTLGGAA